MCPVEGCTSPYLTWHHFDPPYRDGQAHDPHGMIALCAAHHQRADHGSFSNAELRDMKQRVPRGMPDGHFDFRLPQLIVAAGGGLYVRTPALLTVRGRRLIWLSSDDGGRQLLNLDIRGADGTLLFSMRDNAWQVLADIEDLECPPAAKSLILRAPSVGVRLEICFDRLSISDLQGRLEEREEAERLGHNEDLDAEVKQARSDGWNDEQIQYYLERRRAGPATGPPRLLESIQRGATGDEFILCKLTARLRFPVEILISETKIKTPGAEISGLVAIDCGGGLTIG